MEKCLKKLMICIMAVACACSVHISVNAAPGDNANWDAIRDYIASLINPNNTTAPSETTTATDNNTTTAPDTTKDPVNNMGTGTVTTTSTTSNYPTVAPNQDPAGQLTTVAQTTTEPVAEEDSSYGSLIGLLEQDSAAIIVQRPTETYTLNAGLVVNSGENDDGFTWQQAALIAAAVLFVILAALVGALLVQRSKRIKEEAAERRRQNNMASSSSHEPVPVEVMTPERIAELLGTSAGAGRASAATSAGAYSGAIDIGSMTSEDSAAAIKAAILMGQLSQSYSDPLIRKYTEEPVMFSPVSKVNLDEGVTGAQILEATDSMLIDITGNEKYASDISGIHLSTDNIDDILADTETKICPECNSPVASGDVFCHGCGAYVG